MFLFQIVDSFIDFSNCPLITGSIIQSDSESLLDSIDSFHKSHHSESDCYDYS